MKKLMIIICSVGIMSVMACDNNTNNNNTQRNQNDSLRDNRQLNDRDNTNRDNTNRNNVDRDVNRKRSDSTSMPAQDGTN